MTDIRTSDVYRFIEWVTAMHPAVYHLARPLLHGVCRLHEIAEAKRITRDYPTNAARYDFIGVLAGGNPEELAAVKEEATRELVADFYAWLKALSFEWICPVCGMRLPSTVPYCPNNHNEADLL